MINEYDSPLLPIWQMERNRVVQQLAQHYSKSPVLLTDEHLRQYLLYLRIENARLATPVRWLGQAAMQIPNSGAHSASFNEDYTAAARRMNS
jgi:hypothetical protein